MSLDTTKKLRRIYDILFSALLVITGIALATACIQIYRSGDRPFSPESILQHFLPISLLVYGTLVNVIFRILLDMFLSKETGRPKPIIHDDIRLDHQLRKGGPTGGYAEDAQKERTLRRRYVSVTALVFILLMIWPAFYFADIDHFTVTDLNRDVIVSLAIALIPGIAGLGACLLCKHLCAKSYTRELAICKEAAKAGALSTDPVNAEKEHRLTVLRSVIAVIAVVFIIVGIFNGGASDVLLKAIAICTECIGLG